MRSGRPPPLPTSRHSVGQGSRSKWALRSLCAWPPSARTAPLGPSTKARSSWAGESELTQPKAAVVCRYAGGMVRMWRSGRHGVWISDAHEAEAKEAQLRKPPSRVGTWVLRHLGYKGEIGKRGPHAQIRHPHEHP